MFSFFADTGASGFIGLNVFIIYNFSEEFELPTLLRLNSLTCLMVLLAFRMELSGRRGLYNGL